MTKVGCTAKTWVRRWTYCFAASVLLFGATSLMADELGIHAVDIPLYEALWAGSAHADANAEAFVHWDHSDPPLVPTNCAKCHSGLGYQDFLGADGTAAGVMDAAAAKSVIDCTACHNAATEALTSVVFPSGVEVKDLGGEARCMVCHQGRESKVSVDKAITDAGLADPNKQDSTGKLSFKNIHYKAAAATLYGATTMGGYQYDGKSYDIKFAHVKGVDTCIDCHDQHSLEVRMELCATCHPEAGTGELVKASENGLKDIRMVGSLHDYDGDGDTLEGIAGEIETLQATLYAAIQAYGTNAGTPIAYNSGAYPYFFKDINGDGQADPNEAVRANGFASWTPRLLKAAYNYQVSLKDHGAYAHNAKYMIQLLFDSIEDLDPALVANCVRDDAGHFAGTTEAWRHWDEDGKVSGSCSKCHSADGLPFYLREGVTASQPVSNGMLCTTCHDAMPEFTRYEVKTVTFPSGAKLDTGDNGSNLCISCHQGRESTISVNAKIAGLDPDTVAKLSFTNVHYFAAGATLFGTQAKGAYEYEGKTYLGRFAHLDSFDVCTECHETHTGEVKTETCATPFCHGTKYVKNIRKSQTDFDGDGNKSEGIAREIETLQAKLLATIQDYAANVAQAPIAYDGHAYPYFFADTDGNGQADAGEGRYSSWTPRLLQAAYNYQYSQKDPGAFAHNGKYMIQILHDSIADLGTKVTADMSKMVRP